MNNPDAHDCSRRAKCLGDDPDAGEGKDHNARNTDYASRHSHWFSGVMKETYHL
jgi:hypothetical protein